MAVRQPIGQMIESAKARSTNGLSPAARHRLRVQTAIAKLYAAGYSRGKIARMTEKWLLTEEMMSRPADQRRKTSIQKLQRWEGQDSFRDLVWQFSVAKLDIASTAILDGVAARAKEGRVDAARLALEVTGRHNPKGDGTPTAVIIQVNGVPRPARQEEVIEGELVGEDEEL